MISSSVGRGILLFLITAVFASAQESPFLLTYIIQSEQNVVVVEPGGTMFFPPTPINQTAPAVFGLTNTSGAPATVAQISISGAGFGFSALPLFPRIVNPGQTLQVLVLYRPTEAGTDAGQIVLTFAGSPTVVINLAGTGSSPGLVYQVQTDPPADLTPGGSVVFPDTSVGQTSSLTFRVTNSGNADGTINSIIVSGQGFQVTDAPVLPRILAPNASATFTLTFAPSQARALTGRLNVNSDTFELSGLGLGSRLEFSYVSGGNTVVLDGTNNTVVFSPVRITESAQLSFRARNTGTVAATVSNIGADPANGPFSVVEPPALPLTLDPGADLQITIAFSPTTIGFSNGTLRLDATNIALLGSGTAPPPLPAYTITGPSGTATPLSQQNIGLTLADPYPVAVSGTLTLGVTSNLPADPAVQFATGGGSVAFVIPANGTAAVFGGQGTQVGLQIGTVASTVTLTPTFATQAGNVNLTPDSPAVLRFDVAPAAPTLIAAQLTGQTASSFVLNVTGFSTTRTLTSWQIRFTPAEDVNLAGSEFTIDVEQVASAWFRSVASRAFGGQFTIAIPFNFAGTLSDARPVVSAISSVSATMSNSVGSSNTLQVRVQ